MHPLIEMALSEDIGTGDITTAVCVPADRQARGVFVAREHLTVAGTAILQELYDNIELHHHDGDTVEPGTHIARVEGQARRLLTLERTALNFLQHLSGIATLAHEFAKQVVHTKCKVLDTRKTTPGWRDLEKAAAAAGGVTNHRKGLYDAILIKNNHIAAAGSVTKAIENARAAGLPIEIEVCTEAELDEALAAGANHLLLDNLTPEEAKAWIAHINKRAKVELSGGITPENVRSYAETGADYVSAGAITHSARAVDIGFKLELL